MIQLIYCMAFKMLIYVGKHILFVLLKVLDLPVDHPIFKRTGPNSEILSRLVFLVHYHLVKLFSVILIFLLVSFGTYTQNFMLMTANARVLLRTLVEASNFYCLRIVLQTMAVTCVLYFSLYA